MRGLLFLACLVVWACSLTLHAKKHCDASCAANISCWSNHIECLASVGRTREAISKLKKLVHEDPTQSAFATLLATAYVKDNNPVWAERTLQKILLDDPLNCSAWAHLAWVYLQEGDLDLAIDALKRTQCPSNHTEQARWKLLQLYMQGLKQKPIHDKDLRSLGRQTEMYAEDYAFFRHLRKKHQPSWIDPLFVHVEMLGGYSSNAHAGSPTDPGSQGIASPFAKLNLLGRFVHPSCGSVRPMLEGQIKGNGFSHKDADALSYMEVSGRPGLLWNHAYPRFVLAYRTDLLLLNHPTKKYFYEGHRAELEMEASDTWTAFLGGGRRVFREAGRSRLELDGGAGMSLPLSNRAHAMMAFALRYYNAVGDAYDQVGGTGLMMIRFQMPPGLLMRLGGTFALDYFPHSGNTRGALAFGTKQKRQDFLTKLSVGMWSPRFRDIRIGMVYEFNCRNSTADATVGVDNYDYTEHRIALGLRFSGHFSPWDPAILRPKDHVPLDYGIGDHTQDNMEEERVQDLLRQDEAARRGSSCVD